MAAIGERKINAPGSDSCLINSHHHLDCSRRRFAAANRLAILLDRIDPIVHHAAIGDDGGFLFFGGVQRWIAGETFPFLILRIGCPWRGFSHEDGREDIHQNSRGAFGASEEKAPVADDAAHFCAAGEGAVDGIAEGELGGDVVAGDVADLFGGCAAALGGDGFSLFLHAGGAPDRIAGEEAHQV